jgi:hypothetical protein
MNLKEEILYLENLEDEEKLLMSIILDLHDKNLGNSKSKIKNFFYINLTSEFFDNVDYILKLLSKIESRGFIETRLKKDSIAIKINFTFIEEFIFEDELLNYC